MTPSRANADRIRELEQRLARLEDARSYNDPPPFDAVRYWTCEGCGHQRLAAVHATGEVVIMDGRIRVSIPSGACTLTCHKCGHNNVIAVRDEGERFLEIAEARGLPVVRRGG